ncbi:Terminase small subunit [compost metagenome]
MATVKKKPAPVVKPRARSAPAPQPKALTPSEQRFVQEYLVDLNGTQAYMRAYPDAKNASARVQACRLLADPNISDAIAAAQAARAAKLGISAEVALQHVWDIATADARDLVEYRVGCCRHCWGEGFAYQRTDAQFRADRAAHAHALATADSKGKKKLGKFNPQGGPGFDLRNQPNPDCPECAGEGVGRDVYKDTRKLPRAAATLYAGVKRTKDGLQVLTHDKGEALEKAFKHLGLYEKDNRQKSDPVTALLEHINATGSRIPVRK